jgi:hypothetical protein
MAKCTKRRGVGLQLWWVYDPEKYGRVEQEEKVVLVWKLE